MLQGCASQHKEWTEQEDAVIKDNYGKLTYKQMELLLPGRTNQAIQHRRRALGIGTSRPDLVSWDLAWTPKEDKILVENYPTLSHAELSRLLPARSAAAISQRARRLGIKTRVQPRWTSEEDNIVRNGYGKYTCEQMVVFLPGRSKEAIEQRSRLLGIPDKRRIRKYQIDMGFFKEPGVLNSYWAGFIAADGCLTKKKHSVSIVLQQRDGYLLEEFAVDCGFGGKVKYWITGDGYSRAELRIYGVSQWFVDLEHHFNIVPRKSLTLKPPNIADEKYVKAYIRGFIDGDGCIQAPSAKHGWRLQFVGTKDFLNYVQDVCEGWLDKATPKIGDYPYEKICRYRLNGEQALFVLGVLLEVDTPYLSRKWDQVYSCFKE